MTSFTFSLFLSLFSQSSSLACTIFIFTRKCTRMCVRVYATRHCFSLYLFILVLVLMYKYMHSDICKLFLFVYLYYDKVISSILCFILLLFFFMLLLLLLLLRDHILTHVYTSMSLYMRKIGKSKRKKEELAHINHVL